jgi:glycerol-3-phosphate dehydrogenase (NAD(P)+)
MMRFGAALGAEPETLMGLSGLGDLVLTCTDNLSRNRRFGLRMAQSGLSSDAVIDEIGQVVEGVKAAKAVKRIAEQHGLDLPIMEQVYRIITGEKTAQEAVSALMHRDGRSETEHF